VGRALLIVVLLCPGWLLGCANARLSSPEEPSARRPTLTLMVFGRSSNIVLLRPQTVRLTGLLSDAADLSDFECAGIEWTVPGEGGGLNQPLMNCHEVQRYFYKEVTIRHYGRHVPRLRLLNAYTGKVIAEASVEILIQSPEE
jgi:hypothetical protein